MLSDDSGGFLEAIKEGYKTVSEIKTRESGLTIMAGGEVFIV